jgi:hypothetical protein
MVAFERLLEYDAGIQVRAKLRFKLVVSHVKTSLARVRELKGRV